MPPVLPADIGFYLGLKPTATLLRIRGTLIDDIIHVKPPPTLLGIKGVLTFNLIYPKPSGRSC
ncbi:Hypothetical protein FKW44_016902, partial [Caligus rogercresseyi]